MHIVVARAAAVLCLSADALVLVGPAPQRRGKLGSSVSSTKKQPTMLKCSATATGAPEDAFFAKFASLLDEKLEPLEKRMGAMEGKIGGIEGKIGGIEGKIGGIAEKLEPLEKRMGAMERKIGGIAEAEARRYAERQFGEGYGKSLLAVSIQDLSYFFPAEVLNRGPFSGESLVRPLTLIERAAKCIVKERVPLRLLRCAAAKIQRKQPEGSPELEWFEADGSVKGGAVTQFIRASRDRALKHLLKRLLKAVSLKEEEQAQELMRCESAGVMCLLAAAHPALYLEEENLSFILPSQTLEFDLRGRLDVAGDGSSAYIDIGEVKSALAYRKAIEQLGLRLGALKWLVTTCVPSGSRALMDVRLVGRIFVSEAGLEPGDRDNIDFQQRELAADRWRYSLYLHTF